jgi:hypothetical protein
MTRKRPTPAERRQWEMIREAQIVRSPATTPSPKFFPRTLRGIVVRGPPVLVKTVYVERRPKPDQE